MISSRALGQRAVTCTRWWPKPTKVESGALTPFAASTVRRRKALTTSLSHLHSLLRNLDFATSSHQGRDALFCNCDKMLATGRGSIAHVQYTGDEAAGEIKKLLDAVVRNPQPHSCTYVLTYVQVENEDEFERWEALVTRASDLEGGVTRNSSPSAIELVRNVYDCFLTKFPLFFGYWKKYADLEFSIGGTETAEMVRLLLHLPFAIEANDC